MIYLGSVMCMGSFESNRVQSDSFGASELPRTLSEYNWTLYIFRRTPTESDQSLMDYDGFREKGLTFCKIIGHPWNQPSPTSDFSENIGLLRQLQISDVRLDLFGVRRSRLYSFGVQWSRTELRRNQTDLQRNLSLIKSHNEIWV